MACSCLPKNTVTTTTTDPSSGCICFDAYRKLCSVGPDPCDSFSIDVSGQVTNGINDDAVSYSVRDFDSDGLSNVSITSAGVLSGDTNGTGGEEYLVEVNVSVTEDGRTYTVTGLVYICLKNLCKGVTCADGEECENCTGNCVAIGADLEV